MFKVICIKDGVNDFGTGGIVKKGEIYHVLDSKDCEELAYFHPDNPNRGTWYSLVERPNWHWHGLFLPIPYEDEVEELNMKITIEKYE